MSLFQFTSKTNSVVLQIDNQNQIPISGFYIPVVLMPENIKIGFRPTNTIEGLTLIPSIDIGNDSIVIDGVTFGGQALMPPHYPPTNTLFRQKPSLFAWASLWVRIPPPTPA